MAELCQIPAGEIPPVLKRRLQPVRSLGRQREQPLGLTVCVIHAGLDSETKRAAYAADITYGTNNEFGFDYLRDNMKPRLNQQVQGPLHFAIVDEVDSILIDEARTPLIISGAIEDKSDLYISIDEVVKEFPDDWYEKDEKQRSIQLTEEGTEEVEKLLIEKGLLETIFHDLGHLASRYRFTALYLGDEYWGAYALRERLEDVMTLAHAFAVNMAAELRHSYFPGFSPRAASALLKHDWPGNVRELKNTVERSVYRAQDPERPISRIAFDPFDSPYKLQGREGGEKEPAGPRRAPLLPADLPRRLLDTEKELLLAALDKARFNQRMAADLLNLSYHQFRGKLKKHSISGRPAS